MKRKYRGAQRIAPIRARFVLFKRSFHALESISDPEARHEAEWDLLWPDGDWEEMDVYPHGRRKPSVLWALENEARRHGFKALEREIKTLRMGAGDIGWIDRYWSKPEKPPNRRGDRIDLKLHVWRWDWGPIPNDARRQGMKTYMRSERDTPRAHMGTRSLKRIAEKTK